jgi:hypothetical protein
MPDSPTLGPLHAHFDLVQMHTPGEGWTDCEKVGGLMRLPEELIVKTLREVALSMRNEDEAFGEQ